MAKGIWPGRPAFVMTGAGRAEDRQPCRCASQERPACCWRAQSASEIDVDEAAARLKVSALDGAPRPPAPVGHPRRAPDLWRGDPRQPSPETTPDRAAGRERGRQAAIARAALDLVEDGDTLILDAGSTEAALRPAPDPAARLRIITNNLALLPFLAEAPGLDSWSSAAPAATSMSTVGPWRWSDAPDDGGPRVPRRRRVVGRARALRGEPGSGSRSRP